MCKLSVFTQEPPTLPMRSHDLHLLSVELCSHHLCTTTVLQSTEQKPDRQPLEVTQSL